MLKVIKKVGNARLCDFETVHGTIHTPAFMNVATAGAIKGGLSAVDLENIETQVMLCNTYHLHVRPGDDLIHDLGGLHKFTGSYFYGTGRKYANTISFGLYHCHGF